MRSAGKIQGLSRWLGRSQVVVAFAAVVACTGTPEQSSQPLHASLPIRVERSADVPKGRIVFKPISGALFGKAQDIELFHSAAERFDIPVARLVSAIDPHAAAVHSDVTNPGELVEPRDLRIARVATFFESGDAAVVCSNFRTGLRGAWPAQATLLYVDRPGSVQGTRYARPYVMEYDLEFPSAGLYALSSVSEGVYIIQSVAMPDSLVVRVRTAPCTEAADRRQAAP